MGILYIVATPIGNLEDITLRALRILKEVDLIACEDTRVTKKLLNHYSIDTQCITYQQHTGAEKIEKIIDQIKSGKNIAVVTDAGTPGISDPGNILVQSSIENNIQVIPIPGANAVGALVSVAGIDMQQFCFLGFPPHKKGRETFFKKILSQEIPAMYYDSPHRVLKNLELLKNLSEKKSEETKAPIGDLVSKNVSRNSDPSSASSRHLLPGGEGGMEDKQIILGRELTKMFEEIVRGNVEEILGYFQNNPSKIKGEFVVIVY